MARPLRGRPMLPRLCSGTAYGVHVNLGFALAYQTPVNGRADGATVRSSAAREALQVGCQSRRSTDGLHTAGTRMIRASHREARHLEQGMK
mgnify:FL=1|jgi:hypothetical protein